MTWAELLETIKHEGSAEELNMMSPKELTIAQLADLLGVTPIRIYQLQKRKKNPLPLIKSDTRKGRNAWTIKEIPLLQWIEQEETKIDPRKKVEYGKIYDFFNDIFEKRDEIIEKYVNNKS